jgi:hypothetical protein
LTSVLEQYVQTISDDPRASIQLFALGDSFDEKYVDEKEEPSGDVLGSYVWAKAGFQWLNPVDNKLFQDRFLKHLQVNGWSTSELQQVKSAAASWKEPKDLAMFTAVGIPRKAGKPWGRNFLLLRSWNGVRFPNQVQRLPSRTSSKASLSPMKARK